MTENYFVVLQLPATKELNFNNGDDSHDGFWGRAANAIGMGRAKIISRRQDTGVSEEVRQHAGKASRFKTYVLVNMRLKKNTDETTIYKIAAERINGRRNATVIDTTENFQLVTVGK